MNFGPATADDTSTFSRLHREEVFLCPDFGLSLVP